MISLEGRSSQKWTKVNIFVFFHQVFSLTEMYFTEIVTCVYIGGAAYISEPR